ncbi:glucose/quinate/shikimate family membrane-bound PQQ-dependent dehydrogenase [Gallibacterium anatis]|uniref:glucose/quinate/shikimate family membrane-bound PQQ-dependent dehydrogenase n=1 Tax=Gallibacterium anatis TaxID=750 RepID=UPI003006668C
MQERQTSRAGWGKILTVVIFALLAIVLVGAGGWLVALGGSPYYLIVGGLFVLITQLWVKNSPTALWLYVAVFAATLIWALWEVGTDFWALAPRLDIWFALGVWLLLPVANRALSAKSAKKALGVVMAAVLAVLGYSIFNDPQEINGTITRVQPEPATPVAGVAEGDWPAYGRTQEGTRYSPLTQINKDNVKNLQVAWTYHTEDFKTDADSGEGTYEVTPLKENDTLYLCTTHQFLDAVDAATGKRLWRFDPHLAPTKRFQHMTCRGVSYYDETASKGMNPKSAALSDSAPSAVCPRKILLPVNDGRLIAVNAEMGEACSDFGDNGTIYLKKKMPYAYPGGYNPTSPPVVTASTIIIGGSVTDNLSNKEPSGVIRAYDVNSGKLKWIFDTGAKDPNAMPGENTDYVHNSPNAWAPLAYDAERDIVYIPTGVGTPDIWGGDRSELKERYANSVLALDATTGKLLWHFQTTHHDLWDMDVPSQPSLGDFVQNGQKIPAIYVLTKTGNLFVLNRETGEPLVPIEERPVPQKVLLGPQTEGEHYSATQPFSKLDLAPKGKLSDKDMWGATMFDQMVCRIMFKKLNYQGIYTPPSENGTLVFPGNLGVFEWGGLSLNSDRQIALMNPLALPFVSKLKKEDPNRPETIKGSGTESGFQPMYGTPYSVSIEPFLSPLGLPCKQPGWGYIAGVDLTNQEIVWKKRIGTIRDSLPKLRQLPPLKIGVPGLGGVISTAGDVMFVAATQDNYIRAFNASNGEQLWQARLPAGGQATPMTYMQNGKQYVVIMAGGHSSFGTKLGDALVAYALPD